MAFTRRSWVHIFWETYISNKFNIFTYSGVNVKGKRKINSWPKTQILMESLNSLMIESTFGENDAKTC